MTYLVHIGTSAADATSFPPYSSNEFKAVNTTTLCIVLVSSVQYLYWEVNPWLFCYSSPNSWHCEWTVTWSLVTTPTNYLVPRVRSKADVRFLQRLSSKSVRQIKNRVPGSVPGKRPWALNHTPLFLFVIIPGACPVYWYWALTVCNNRKRRGRLLWAWRLLGTRTRAYARSMIILL